MIPPHGFHNQGPLRGWQRLQLVQCSASITLGNLQHISYSLALSGCREATAPADALRLDSPNSAQGVPGAPQCGERTKSSRCTQSASAGVRCGVHRDVHAGTLSSRHASDTRCEKQNKDCSKDFGRFTMQECHETAPAKARAPRLVSSSIAPSTFCLTHTSAHLVQLITACT